MRTDIAVDNRAPLSLPSTRSHGYFENSNDSAEIIQHSRYVLLIAATTLCSVLLAAAPVKAADAARRHSVPTAFQVFSDAGNESLQAECTQEAGNNVSCKFVDFAFVVPDAKRIDRESQQLREFRDQRSREIRPRAAPAPLPLDAKGREAIQRRIENPLTGPKTKDFLRQLLDLPTDEFAAASVMLNHDSRTCHVVVQTFDLSFTNIGPGKWLSNPGPTGLCKVMKVQELTAEPNYDVLWTLTETTVAVGNTDPPLCSALAATVNQREVFAHGGTLTNSSCRAIPSAIIRNDRAA